MSQPGHPDDELDRAHEALRRARHGEDPRPLLAALSPGLRAEAERAIESERRVLGAGEGAARPQPAPPPPAPQRGVDPALGQTLSGCRLERLLGRGGMGAAYLARAQDGAPVVVKLMALQAVAHDARALARFQREADALRRVGRHPNVAGVLAASTDPSRGPPHLVLEYVEGPTLRAHLHARGALPAQEVARIGRDVARGLAALHGHGLLHRDVKPDNIVLAPDGRARLIDFGIAKDVFLSALTEPGQLVGTAEFMSPEQWTGAPQDARVDLFALGATLFTALAGRPPFSGPLEDIKDQATTGTYDLPDGLPAGLELLVRCLLDPDPRFRPARAEQVALDLEGALRGAAPTSVPGLALLVDGRPRDLQPLVGSDRFVVGSAASAAVRVAGNGVAPEHCEVRRGDEGFSVNDLRSPTGTFVGDARVKRGQVLEDGDVVRIGDARLALVHPGASRRPPAWLDDLVREERPVAVVSALARAGDPRALAALLELLEPDPAADAAALDALRAVAPADVAALVERRARLVAEARAAAPALLAQASGEALGQDPVAWLSWFVQARARHARQVGPTRPAAAISLAPVAGGAAVAMIALAGEPGVVLVGRDERCHLRLDGATVSRLHATVLRLHRRLVVRDEGGAGGTWLGERRVQVAFLDPGATVRFGDVAVAVQGGEAKETTPDGARVVDPFTFQALDELGHPAALSGHLLALEVAQRPRASTGDAALDRSVEASSMARVARARTLLGPGVTPSPASFRALLSRHGPQVVPSGL